MLAFNEPHFTPGRWHEAKYEILEVLGLHIMSFDIPDGIFCESFSFEHRGTEKSDLVDSLIFQP